MAKHIGHNAFGTHHRAAQKERDQITKSRAHQHPDWGSGHER